MGLTICALASGSSGNATYITTGRTSVLVDCGTSAREVTARLASIDSHPSRLDGILITHAHSDHYRSAGTLHARFGVPVYVDPSTARALGRRGHWTSWRRVQETRPIPDRIGDLEVQAIDTSHGFGPHDGRTVAYLLRHQSSRVGVVTDLGIIPEAMRAQLRGVDALLIEANHDEEIVRRKLSDLTFATDWRYLSWVLGEQGHLSNRQCAEALSDIVTREECHVFLGHLSENHRDPRRDNNDHRLAFAEVEDVLRRRGAPVPQLHRTWRIGREGAGPSTVVRV
jgi:phosphoribosyl 1,2-cyclic phosphodiesterase